MHGPTGRRTFASQKQNSMKRTLISAWLLVAACMFADAQSKHTTVLSGGPLLETNLSGFIHSGFERGNSKMKAGVTAGGFAELSLSDHFSIRGEMGFQYKHSRFGWNNESGCYSYWGMEIPIYVTYNFSLCNEQRFYLGIGPYTNFGLSAHFKNGDKSVNLYEKDINTGFPPMKDSDTGFGIKAGYEFSCGMQINIGYKVSVSNIIDANSSNVKMNPQTLSIGVAYRFGK